MQDSSPTGFSTFLMNWIGPGLRFYSSLRIRIFKFHCFVIWRQHNHKKNFCKVKGCNVVHISCKCVKVAQLHRTCHALQSTSPPETSTDQDWIKTEANFWRIRTGSDSESFCCFNVIILKISKILVVIWFHRFAKW